MRYLSAGLSLFLTLRIQYQPWRTSQKLQARGPKSPNMYMYTGRLWLRGRASVSLSEGRWIDSPGPHVEVSLSEITNPKLLRMCWSTPCVAATAIICTVYTVGTGCAYTVIDT